MFCRVRRRASRGPGVVAINYSRPARRFDDSFDVLEIPVQRLAGALAHAELAVDRVTEDEQRPRFHCRVLRLATHRPFLGFNRAQAAVIEAAILISRLDMLPREKIEQEIAYLQIAISKTAGTAEREAWQWLMETVATRYAGLP